jgi:hypothetical protein
VLDPDRTVPADAARRHRALLVAAQVADEPHAQAVEHVEVGRAEALEAVGAEEAAPAHAPSAGPGIPAEVAEVHGAVEGEPPLSGVGEH